MNDPNEWRPSCTLTMLQIRAAMLRAARQFFYSHNFLEVETPCLSRDIVIDAWLEPFEFTHSEQRWFLQTSPEAGMKRLLAAGANSIFQVSRVFRKGEMGDRHNPEFTMLEWYGVGSTWNEQLLLTESLVRTCLDAAAQITGINPGQTWATPFACTTYAGAFHDAFSIDVHTASGDELLAVARQSGVPVPESCDAAQRDEILNAMLAFAIEPRLGQCRTSLQSSPEFLCDYPPSQAALAVTSTDTPQVARRFELYINGLELCNGYQELTDVEELQRRERIQNSVRVDSHYDSLPGASRMMEAMKSGLPECSGVALGFDRLVMVATNSRTISEVMAFAADRA